MNTHVICEITYHLSVVVLQVQTQDVFPENLLDTKKLSYLNSSAKKRSLISQLVNVSFLFVVRQTLLVGSECGKIVCWEGFY